VWNEQTGGSGGPTPRQQLDRKNKEIEGLVDKMGQLHEIRDTLLGMVAEEYSDGQAELKATISAIDKTVVYFEIKSRRAKLEVKALSKSISA